MEKVRIIDNDVYYDGYKVAKLLENTVPQTVFELFKVKLESSVKVEEITDNDLLSLALISRIK
jgi:hypothetical protein